MQDVPASQHLAPAQPSPPHWPQRRAGLEQPPALVAVVVATGWAVVATGTRVAGVGAGAAVVVGAGVVLTVTGAGASTLDLHHGVGQMLFAASCAHQAANFSPSHQSPSVQGPAGLHVLPVIGAGVGPDCAGAGVGAGLTGLVVGLVVVVAVVVVRSGTLVVVGSGTLVVVVALAGAVVVTLVVVAAGRGAGAVVVALGVVGTGRGAGGTGAGTTPLPESPSALRMAFISGYLPPP